MTLTTGWSSIVPNLMLVPLTVSEELKQTDRQNCALYIRCSSCKTQANNTKQFDIIRECQTSYEAEIHEALVIKRSSPVLNKQLCANGASFLVGVF